MRDFDRTTPPTRDELLELASFEMLGALDEVEIARFERALADAPASVQAEVVALQAKMAVDPLFRDTSEEPSTALRLRTMARLIEEVEADAANAAPIATIGPRAGIALRAAPASDALTADSMREILTEVASRSSVVKPQRQLFWRAASFFLLAALSVALYFTHQFSRTALQLAEGVNERALSVESLEAAARVAGFDLDRAVPVELRRVDEFDLGDRIPSPIVRARVQGAGAAGIDGAPGVPGHILVTGLDIGNAKIVRVVVKDRDGIVLRTRQTQSNAGGVFAAYMLIEQLPPVGTLEVELEDGAVYRASYAV